MGEKLDNENGFCDVSVLIFTECTGYLIREPHRGVSEAESLRECALLRPAVVRIDSDTPVLSTFHCVLNGGREVIIDHDWVAGGLQSDGVVALLLGQVLCIGTTLGEWTVETVFERQTVNRIMFRLLSHVPTILDWWKGL